MIKRLAHLVCGHSFRLRTLSHQKGNVDFGWKNYDSTVTGFQNNYGFTEFVFFCECGAFKVRRAVGKHDAFPEHDSEKTMLRKMAGLQ